VGAKLEIVYEPIKIGQKDGQVFVEAHPDVYRRIPDYPQYAMDKLVHSSMAELVDNRRFLMAVRLQSGVPINVTRFNSEGVSLKMVENMHQ
jgi:L,D-transpeptidase ErfK/SrfK